MEGTPEDKVWKRRERMGVPERFRNQVPIFEVVDGYSLDLSGEILSVERFFITKDCNEGLRVCYELPGFRLRPLGNGAYEEIHFRQGIQERLTIYGGKITEASVCYPKKLEFNENRPEELGEAMQKYFDSYKSQGNSYHNIKRFEDRLKVLPWQDDLCLIYSGTGRLD